MKIARRVACLAFFWKHAQPLKIVQSKKWPSGRTVVATGTRLAKKLARASHVLAVIDKLYQVKTETRDLSAAAERQLLREEHSRLLLNDLKT
ncbi:MAG: hypothetical protein R3C20_15970 [Planctomycetaceae bacterium]